MVFGQDSQTPFGGIEGLSYNGTIVDVDHFHCKGDPSRTWDKVSDQDLVMYLTRLPVTQVRSRPGCQTALVLVDRFDCLPFAA
jgi:hypothetical protein